MYIIRTYNGSRLKLIFTIDLSSSTTNFGGHYSHANSVIMDVSDRILIFHYSISRTEWFTTCLIRFTTVSTDSAKSLLMNLMTSVADGTCIMII